MSDSEEKPEADEPSWPITVKLRVPIEFGSERVDLLTFRRGRLSDMKGVKLGNELSVDYLLLVASRMCSKSLPILERLDQDDVAEVLQIAARFFGKCLATGSAA